MLDDKTLDTLDAAEKAATPGQWTHECVRESPQTKEFALRLLVVGKKSWHTEIPYTLSEHDTDFNNANFIALARNSMRQLIDEVVDCRYYFQNTSKAIDERRETIKKLRAALLDARNAINLCTDNRPIEQINEIADAEQKRIDESGLLK